MRDHDIAYGSNKASLAELRETSLSRQVMGFLDKHADLLHADADVSWVLDAIDAEVYSVLDQPPHRDAPKQHGADMATEADYETGPQLTPWLSSIYKSGPSPSFDVGALAFFRSQSHQVLLDHLDETSNLYEGGLDDTLVPTISASMFLPQKSVWNFRHKDGRATRPRPPESTAEPRMRLWRRLKRPSQGPGVQHRSVWPSRYVQRNSMAEWLAIRDLMAQDLQRQNQIPRLRSGNTVVDERNFALDWASQQECRT